MNKIVDLVCASDFEEFFYKEDDMPVSEGTARRSRFRLRR